jgi:hypothetical protein
MPSQRRQFLRTVAGGLAASLLLGIAMAQTPTVTVNDYLSEVRIFAPGSPDFARIAASLGVDATLPTLGPGASLVAAIRNDSGQAIDSMRIIFSRQKGGDKPVTSLELGRGLEIGGARLVAPREVGGALARTLKPGTQGVMSGGSPTVEPLDAYQGTTLTISIDSATLADGKFIGADTLTFFSRLVENDARQKAFFAELIAHSKTASAEVDIKQMLTARKAQARSAQQSVSGVRGFLLADQTEFGLATTALVQLEHFGMANVVSWVEHENAKLESRPTLHR